MRPDGRDGKPRCTYSEVRREGRKVVVVCVVCGPTTFTPRQASDLAERLRGPLGRFETAADRPERFRLAELLDPVSEAA